MRTTSLAGMLVLLAMLATPATAQGSEGGPQFSTLAGSAGAAALATASIAPDPDLSRGPALAAPPVVMTTTAVRLADGRIEQLCEQLPSHAAGETVIRSVVPALERRK